ncbi:unnamed protein product [Arctia plantaginis]|uniref:Uncharacterized protein n=1 Tax=Arctia plantaginis TaxID=874455 RepID=A0A8S1BFT2_ARCPL|nr:unnamed protein product [Arctia plantaginis]
MSSRETEDLHLSLLKQLLDADGLECVRTPSGSLEESLDEGQTEELGPESVPEEAHVEITQAQEEEVAHPEAVREEEPEIFPSPSLRRLLPDKVRQIEAENRIHVLPASFKTEIDPQAIPRILSTPQQRYIEILGDLVGCTMYRTSLAEYWFLDTMANLLRRAQRDELNRQTQAVLILWFCEWMKEMQHFDEASRPRMLKRFKDNMLAVAGHIVDTQQIPTPEDVGVYYMAKEAPVVAKPTASSPVEPMPSVTFEWAAYQCSLIDLTKIIHYIFDLFSTDYQYDLVRSIFTYSPDYIHIDMPYQIQNPKKMYAPLKAKPPKKEAKKAEVKPKGKKKDDTPISLEYIALMELKAREEKCLEELEQTEREQWNRKSHILPLQFATTDELFDKYWPPPTPPPEPEKEPEPKPKGKKK